MKGIINMAHELQSIAFNKALKLLDAIGAQYAIKFNGEVHGTLALAPERKGRPSLYQRGETHKYFWPLIKDMAVGEVRDVPLNGFDGPTLSRNISSACVHNFGVGCSIVSLQRNADAVSVLRIG